MKKNKKIMMVLSFSVGALMFVSTAYADITSKGGYDQLKDAVKYTAEGCTERFDSFKLEGTFTLKDGDKELLSSSFIEKVDDANHSSENSSSTVFSNGEKESSYFYNDSKQGISYNGTDNIYYVTDYLDQRPEKTSPRNPFKEDRAKDAEKIFDALVGNLKDYVVLEEKADGSKEFSGSISEAQIPALVNAVSSFGLKQVTTDMVRNQNMMMPEIKDDVFIRGAKGRVIINKDGIIESLYASGELVGKDSKGNIHNMKLEFLGKVNNINATSVTAPDLNGKKVERNTETGSRLQKVSQRFVGKYKNDIVIEKDDSFIKVGERFIDVIEADDRHIAGRYYEQYNTEYSQYEDSKYDFTFDAEVKDNFNAEFVYTNTIGVKKNGSINFDIMFGKIYINIDSKTRYDSVFSRVFES